MLNAVGPRRPFVLLRRDQVEVRQQGSAFGLRLRQPTGVVQHLVQMDTGAEGVGVQRAVLNARQPDHRPQMGHGGLGHAQLAQPDGEQSPHLTGHQVRALGQLLRRPLEKLGELVPIGGDAGVVERLPHDAQDLHARPAEPGRPGAAEPDDVFGRSPHHVGEQRVGEDPVGEGHQRRHDPVEDEPLGRALRLVREVPGRLEARRILLGGLTPRQPQPAQQLRRGGGERSGVFGQVPRGAGPFRVEPGTELGSIPAAPQQVVAHPLGRVQRDGCAHGVQQQIRHPGVELVLRVLGRLRRGVGAAAQQSAQEDLGELRGVEPGAVAPVRLVHQPHHGQRERGDRGECPRQQAALRRGRFTEPAKALPGRQGVRWGP